MSDSRRSKMAPTGPDTNGHEYVDLGLPSGTLWATMNVGATSPSDYGNYYKYGSGATAGATDDSYYSGTESPLVATADTATQVWGGSWHMPTREQLRELTTNTNYSWIWIKHVSGKHVYGEKFTSKTDSSKYIFLPAGGHLLYGRQTQFGSYGYYWSSTPIDRDRLDAYFLYFETEDEDDYDDPSVGQGDRRCGFLVRPVIG